MQVESTLITRSQARQKGEGLLVPQRNSVREIFVEIGPRLDCGGGSTSDDFDIDRCFDVVV